MNLPNMYYNQPNLNQLTNQGNINQTNQNIDNEIDENYSKIIKETKTDEYKINKEISNNKVFKAYSHIFDANMEEVVSIFIDEKFFNNPSLSDIIDNVKFPKDLFSKSEETLVYIRWKKFYNIKLVCSNQIRSKNNISYKMTIIEMIPSNIGSLEVTFKYYYNTCQNNTLFVIEYIIDKGILSEVFKEEFLDLDMKKICFNVEKIIHERKKEKTHVSSLLLNISKEKAWNNITNMNKKRFINYMNKYHLYYLSKDEIEKNSNENNIINDDEIKNNNKDYHIQKGDCIVIKKNENDIFSKLIIDEIIEGKDKNEISFICNKSNNQTNNENSIYEGENDKNTQEIKTENIEVLNQKIVLSIKEITKDVCYLEYKHIWEDWVSINKINSLDFLKINSLKIYKQLLTNNNNEDEKIRNDQDNPVLNLFNLICPIEL